MLIACRLRLLVEAPQRGCPAGSWDSHPHRMRALTSDAPHVAHAQMFCRALAMLCLIPRPAIGLQGGWCCTKQAAGVGAAAPGKPAAPAAAAAASGADGKADGSEAPGRRGGAWWQWLLVVIAMPLLAILSLVRAHPETLRVSESKARPYQLRAAGMRLLFTARRLPATACLCHASAGWSLLGTHAQSVVVAAALLCALPGGA